MFWTFFWGFVTALLMCFMLIGGFIIGVIADERSTERKTEARMRENYYRMPRKRRGGYDGAELYKNSVAQDKKEDDDNGGIEGSEGTLD